MEQDPDNGQRAAFAPVHEVHFQRQANTLDRVLGGVVKVELLQLVSHSVDNDAVAGSRVDLDRMPGVLDGCRRRPVVEPDGHELLATGAAQVDR